MPVLAQSANSSVYEILYPSTIRANEAFDVTIKVHKSDGTVDTVSENSIFFAISPQPSGTVIPNDFNNDSDQPYKFTLSDQGTHVFSKAFTISKAGEYTLTVYDYLDIDIESSIKLTVTDDSNPFPSASEDVFISEPVTDTTIGSSSVTLRGTTKATSSLDIYLNDTKIGSTQSDVEGKFSYEISQLVEGSNTIKVNLLDGNNQMIGSSYVSVKYTQDAPKINSILLKEWSEVLSGSVLNLEAHGDPGLKSVIAKMNSKPVVLEETSTLGTYTGTTIAPTEEGDVQVDVIAQSQLGTTAEFKNLTHFAVIVSKIENVKVETTTDKKVRFTFTLRPDLDIVSSFRIKYGTKTLVYDKQVDTYEKSQIRDNTTGEYSWYIPDLLPGEYFATIIALDTNKKETSIVSWEQGFSIALDAAPTTCYIDQVSGITVKKEGNVSIISWDHLADAATYQIFKKDTSGEFAMIDEVTDTSYKIRINLDSEKEVFEDFKVRATCRNGDFTAEWAFSESVAVQTWPGVIIFMVLLMASGTAFILMKRGYLR